MLGPSIIGGGGAGKAGADGATPALQAGNAAALPPGSAPQVALREVAAHTYALDVAWPLAADGQPGASPTLQIGNVTALASNAAATAAVRDVGGHAYAIDLGIPVGAAGAPGGPPTLQVGNVTTLASGAQATAAVRSLGGGAYAVDLGIPPGPAGPAGANLGTLRRVYISSAEITASNASYGFAAAVPAGATEVEVECVGGGSSGFSGRHDTQNGIYFAGHGGYPGGVSRRRLNVADVPATLAVTIGAGGADIAPQVAVSRTNGGGATTFGTLVQAAGGPAVSHATMADLPNPGVVRVPSDIPLGHPGLAGTSVNTAATVSPPAGGGNSATPSHGPGAGGSGLPDAAVAGGDGGISGCGRPDTALRGGTQAGVSFFRHGLDATSVFGYGSGGCGARYVDVSPPWPYTGGNGRAPGGGGGGGPGLPPSGYWSAPASRAGAGGRGAVRLHFYRYEAP